VHQQGDGILLILVYLNRLLFLFSQSRNLAGLGVRLLEDFVDTHKRFLFFGGAITRISLGGGF
jgi:hypothetical protein